MIVSAATMLTQGSIVSLAINPYDSPFTSAFTRYDISVQPIHLIPSTNKIKVQFPTTGNAVSLVSASLASC